MPSHLHLAALARQAGASERIGLRGGRMTPGWFDAHVHFMWWGFQMSELDLRATKTIEEALDQIGRGARELAAGRWLTGGRFDKNTWGRWPTAAELDRVTGARPPVMRSRDGHCRWLNNAALRAAKPEKRTIVRERVSLVEQMDVVVRAVRRAGKASFFVLCAGLDRVGERREDVLHAPRGAENGNRPRVVPALVAGGSIAEPQHRFRARTGRERSQRRESFVRKASPSLVGHVEPLFQSAAHHVSCECVGEEGRMVDAQSRKLRELLDLQHAAVVGNAIELRIETRARRQRIDPIILRFSQRADPLDHVGEGLAQQLLAHVGRAPPGPSRSSPLKPAGTCGAPAGRLETAATIRDLLNERGQVSRYADVRAFTSQAPSRLEVLASDRDPAVSVAFGAEDYSDVARVLEHFYSVCITDCGTGLLHSAMAGVLTLADQIILVSSPSVDGARSASATLDWLEAHDCGDLVRNGVVVLSTIRPRSKSTVDLDRLEHHFAARCRAVARIPYDPHLEEGAEVDLELLSAETADAYLTLAGLVGDGLAWPRRLTSRSGLP